MNTPSPLIIRALEAALSLSQIKAWKIITLVEIAAHADISLSELYGITDKDRLIDALEGWADGAMSSERADMKDTPRERLFDIIMRRFEHMEPYREGLLPIMRLRDRAPTRLAALVQARKASAQWALICAGLDHGSGAERAARGLSVAWAIGKTERAWRSDTGGDFARTMATLDAELAMAEDRLSGLARFSGTFGSVHHRAREAHSSAPEVRPEETDAA